MTGTFVGTLIGGYSIDVAGLLRTFLDLMLLSFAAGGVGLLLMTVFRSAAATGVTGGLLVAGFFLTTIAGLLSRPAWTTRPSVFDAFGTPYLSLPAAGGLAYLGVLGSAGALAAYLVMRRGMRICCLRVLLSVPVHGRLGTTPNGPANMWQETLAAVDRICSDG